MACEIKELLSFIDEIVEEYGVASLGADLRYIARDIMKVRSKDEAVEMIESKLSLQKKSAVADINIDSTDKNEYAGLSNFNAGPVKFDGIKFDTIEAAYQYQKAKMANDENAMAKLSGKISGYDAFTIGRAVEGLNVKEWDKVSDDMLYDVMEAAYKQSYSGDGVLANLLLSTGDAKITHMSDKGKVRDQRFPANLEKIRSGLQNAESIEGKPTAEAASVVVMPMKNIQMAEANGVGINVLRKNSIQNYGNPFGVTGVDTISTVPNSGTGEEVSDMYKAWLEGTAHQEVEPDRRAWILNQVKSGKLDGKKLLYYKNTKYNHAVVLRNFVNNRNATAVNTTTNRFTVPENITELEDNQIFVFGSNEKGIHGAGAAKHAIGFGAIPYRGTGLAGQTYAVPTKSTPAVVLDTVKIERYIDI